MKLTRAQKRIVNALKAGDTLCQPAHWTEKSWSLFPADDPLRVIRVRETTVEPLWAAGLIEKTDIIEFKLTEKGHDHGNH